MASTRRILALEGNIGAGKTTLLRYIRDNYPDIVIIDEPVDTWESITDPDGKNILQYFYGDMARWSYTFQNIALLTRIQNIERALKDNPTANVFLMERSYLTDRNVFAKMLHEDGKISDLEMKIYMKWYDHFTVQYPIDTILWLDTNVPTCIERIHRRNRPGEEGISEEYLTRLDNAHRDWLISEGSRVITIPDNISIQEKCTQYIARFKHS
jgi:deoxyadenosine/deoxycytidine kinase